MSHNYNLVRVDWPEEVQRWIWVTNVFDRSWSKKGSEDTEAQGIKISDRVVVVLYIVISDIWGFQFFLNEGPFGLPEK